MTNTSAILESLKDLTPAQIAAALKKMTPEQLQELSGQIDPVTVRRLLPKRNRGGRPPVKKPCPYCGREMTARKLWAHKPGCKRKRDPNYRGPGRPAGWHPGGGPYAAFEPSV